MQTRQIFLIQQFQMSSDLFFFCDCEVLWNYDDDPIYLLLKITADYSILFLLQNAFFVFLSPIDKKAIQ